MIDASIKRPPNNLKAWRLHRGLSQRAIAEAVGTTTAVISQIEKGQRGLSHGWLERIAPLLDTTAGAILDFMPDEIDGDLVRAAVKVPMERHSDALALLKWMSRDSVHLVSFDTSVPRARRL